MEQPLPMSGTLGQDHHYPPDTKPSMSDMPFNMSGKMMSEGFNMSSMQADMRDMIAHPQDFNSPGSICESGGGGGGGELSDQMAW